MEDKIKTIMAEILDIDEEEFTPDFGPGNADEWDSLNNLKMLTAIESEFNIQLSMTDIQEMTTVAAIFSLVAKHVA